jgi:predicted short-subunit dehydrogenase-like oxidoreductase (DUF2520 family)
MPEPTSIPSERWHIVGLGRAGRTFAWLLRERLAQVSVSGSVRSDSSLAALPEELRAPVTVGHTIPADADVVLFAVPDDTLQRAVNAAAAQGDRPRVWLHCSGVTPVAALRSLPGFHGSVHPLQSMQGRREDVLALEGAIFAVAGDEPALIHVTRLVQAARGQALAVPDEARAAYHLAAVIAGNGVFALLQAGRQIATLAGLDADLLQTGLAGLAAHSANNASQSPLATIATGPLIRGDGNTVRRHRGWLRHNAAELGPLYQALGRLLLELADERGLAPTALTAAAVVLEE